MLVSDLGFEASSKESFSFISLAKVISSLFQLGQIQTLTQNPKISVVPAVIPPTTFRSNVSVVATISPTTDRKVLRNLFNQQIHNDPQNNHKQFSWLKSYNMILEHQILSLTATEMTLQNNPFTCRESLHQKSLYQSFKKAGNNKSGTILQ